MVCLLFWAGKGKESITFHSRTKAEWGVDQPGKKEYTTRQQLHICPPDYYRFEGRASRHILCLGLFCLSVACWPRTSLAFPA